MVLLKPRKSVGRKKKKKAFKSVGGFCEMFKGK